MIKVVIVDDEALARMRVRELLKTAAADVRIVGEADCGRTAVEVLNRLRPDALFLDIQMPDMSGFEVLQQLSFQPMVVFTTAYSEYAIQAFETLSIDYLVKPLELDRFRKAIDKLKRFSKNTSLDNLQKIEQLFEQMRPTKQSFALPVKKKDRIVLIDFEDISHFKAEDKYVLAHLKDGATHLLNKTISQLEEELPSEFIRVHRSYIVNRTYIQEIEKHFRGRLVLRLRDRKRHAIKTGETYSQRIRDLLGL